MCWLDISMFSGCNCCCCYANVCCLSFDPTRHFFSCKYMLMAVCECMCVVRLCWRFWNVKFGMYTGSVEWYASPLCISVGSVRYLQFDKTVDFSLERMFRTLPESSQWRIKQSTNNSEKKKRKIARNKKKTQRKENNSWTFYCKKSTKLSKWIHHSFWVRCGYNCEFSVLMQIFCGTLL